MLKSEKIQWRNIVSIWAPLSNQPLWRGCKGRCSWTPAGGEYAGSPPPPAGPGRGCTQRSSQQSALSSCTRVLSSNPTPCSPECLPPSHPLDLWVWVKMRSPPCRTDPGKPEPGRKPKQALTAGSGRWAGCLRAPVPGKWPGRAGTVSSEHSLRPSPL